jgi:signal transduction histidine kinase
LAHRKKYVVYIISFTLLITYLHYSTLPIFNDLHNIFTELYYIPLLGGAIVFGLRGAILVYLFITVLYFPFILMNWSNDFSFMANKLLHALFSGFFAFLAGTLTNREKHHRKRLEEEKYLAGLGQAAASIVHDLKTPIIAISGFARRIQQKKGNMDASIQTIIDSAGKMEMIVQDVLDFAKPIRLSLEKKDIRSIIKQACDTSVTKADMRGISLSVDLPAVPVHALIDGIHTERALVNLINNAVDSSEKGETVNVQLTEEKDSIDVIINDNGSGMDKETFENIFIPFYTKKSSGTGLGMVIVKKIIEGHNWKIHVTSNVGSGTRVTMKLPHREIEMN